MKKSKTSILSTLLVFIFVLTWGISGLVFAQSNDSSQLVVPKVKDLGETPSSAIFIGNSFFYFNNGISGHVSAMVKEGMPEQKYRSTLVTIAGAGLDWHDVNSYFRPNGIGSYSTSNDGKNTVTFKDPKEKLFDVAIMMDNSQGPVHPVLKQFFAQYAKLHSDTVRKYGAKPILFMTWAYADKPEMTQQLDEAYTKVANANDALVIPAGLAFAKVTTERPDIILRIKDQRHPTVAGTYLAAATVYATLFKQSPVGLKYNAGLDDSVARYLQEAAWDAVQEYFNR